MARRIEFIAPVESMRGNLSGDQKLTYPTEDNTAWDAPTDKRSYATNYQPRYIGAKRASDGLKYFAVKVRSAVRNSPAQRQVQAVLAGTKLSVDALKADVDQGLPLLALFAYQKETAKTLPEDLTFDKWLSQLVRHILEAKIGEYTIPGPYPTGASQIILGNAWVPGSVPASSKYIPDISDEYLVKFWNQLSVNGMYFYIDNAIGVSRSADQELSDVDFSTIITGNTPPNVLNLTTQTIGQVAYLKYNGLYVVKADRTTYLAGDDSPAVNEHFYTTAVAPSA